MDSISYSVAFGAGFLSVLSPCVLPMLPVYFATLCGTQALAQGTAKNRLAIFLHALTFVSGFSIMFIILGTGAGLAGFALNVHLDLVQKISGAVLIVFGVFVLVALKIPRINIEKRLPFVGRQTTSYLGSFLTGIVFSLAWTPCVGPALGSILTLAWSSETAMEGGYLLAIYSLGFALPFLIMGAAFNWVAPLFRKLSRYSFTLQIISGVFLIAIGILIVTNNLGGLQGL
jgi:cytochrome c-type biogenesis protein